MPYTTQAALSHPKIKALKIKLHNTISLAIEKTIGHMQHPEQYPLPSDSN